MTPRRVRQAIDNCNGIIAGLPPRLDATHDIYLRDIGAILTRCTPFLHHPELRHALVNLISEYETALQRPQRTKANRAHD